MQALMQLAMYYKRDTLVVSSDGMVEQLMLAKLRSQVQCLELLASTVWHSEMILINVQHNIVVTSKPYLSKQQLDSLRDRPTKSVVEKLFLLKIIRAINFHGFHCLQKFYNNELFPTTVLIKFLENTYRKQGKIREAKLSWFSQFMSSPRKFSLEFLAIRK